MFQAISFNYLEGVPYSDDFKDSRCHTVDIWLSEFPISEGYWVIFLHGGAWHDPDITSSFAKPAIAVLQNSPICRFVKGFASLNYRLSPHPDHTSSPSLPSDTSRNAIHPDHICDVIGGIEYLQRRFQFGDRYILLGHSCGATLAFQTITQRLALNDRSGKNRRYATPPKAIVGVAGLYDLVLLRDMDPEPPACQQFLSHAFGPDEQVWRGQSPVNGNYETIWGEGRVVVLVRCLEDEYVSPEQSTAMKKALMAWSEQEGTIIKCKTEGGRHDACWKEGYGLAYGIEEALSHLLDEV